LYFDEDKDLESEIEKEYNVTRKMVLSKNADNHTVKGFEIKIDDFKNYDKVCSKFLKLTKIKTIEQVIGDTLPVMMSNLFYVKLKKEVDTLLLKKMATNTKTNILRKVPYCDNWYALEISKKSISNCLDVSNIFSETGYFDKIDPGFIFNFSNEACFSDARYSEQWVIDGIGADINACSAWGITKGTNNISVAIIDNGIDKSHSEFTGVSFTPSFDAKSRTSPAQIYGDHGQHVCGIIASNHNQSNIAGVAPGLSIMEVSHPFTLSPTLSEELAAGINWAVNNGAHVINNSWGDQGRNNMHSVLLEDAIDNALINGRSGLGCIVVFAAGNKSYFINYPANYRSEILVVGAIYEYENIVHKSVFSGVGPTLDVIAPGQDILSTLNNNQYGLKSGTSMAAPHVSAIAGLILSKNPNLTRAQVTNIIESSTQKSGYHSYQTTVGRNNGTWNDYMGYGLVDAFAALEATCVGVTNYINQNTITNTTINGCEINVQNVNVQNNSTLLLNAQTTTTINGPFEVLIGSQLDIRSN